MYVLIQKAHKLFLPRWCKHFICTWAMIAAVGSTRAAPITRDSAATNPLSNELLQAISSNNPARVRSILALQPGLSNTTNQYGEPAIVLAAGGTNVEIIRMLLGAGAVVDATGWRQVTALQAALESMVGYRYQDFRGVKLPKAETEARLAIAGLLLDRGASIYTTNNFRQILIQEAAGCGNGDLVDFLLLRQRPVNSMDAEGNSKVHLAALWARTNVLKVLAEQKADFEATNHSGLTPLQAVSRLPHYQEREGMLWNYWTAGLTEDGLRYREWTARLLVQLGAKVDIFSAVPLAWTNAVSDLMAKNPDVVREQNGLGQTALHWAAEFGEAGIARALLQAGAPVECADLKGCTALDVAAAKGQAEVIEVLVKHGAGVVRRPKTKAPLHWAAEQGNLLMLEFLLKSGADQDAEDEQGQTPLDWAARNNHESVVRLLLARHARLKLGGQHKTTPLHWATAHANTNLIGLLLQTGCDLNARNAEDKSPIQLASDQDNFTLLEFLLGQGADINAADTNGNTVLHLRAAAEVDYIVPPVDPFRRQAFQTSNVCGRSMMAFLISHQAKLEAVNRAGETPLHRVATKGFNGSNAVEAAATWLQPLITNRANINARDTNGRTPLHLAAQAKNVPVMEALIHYGAKVNARDSAGKTPLHLAVEDIDPLGKSLPVVASLVKHRAKVSLADTNGVTPLHSAVAPSATTFGAERPIVSLLLSHNASVNAVDKAGRTPLHIASASKYHSVNECLVQWQFKLMGDVDPFEVWYVASDILETNCVLNLLLKAGADVNLRDSDGNTALHNAAITARKDLVKLLVDNHASRTMRNREGKTPLQLAYEHEGGFEIIPMLQPDAVSGEIADAARRGDLKMVKAFLKAEPTSANWPWLIGSTPLHWAANNGHIKIVRTLLEHGAKVDPPLRVSDRRNKLIEFNGLMNPFVTDSNQFRFSNSSIIHSNKATHWEHWGTNFFSWFTWASKLTPLQLALAGGHADIARMLVEHGAKVDLASAAELGLTNEMKRAILKNPNCLNEVSRWSSWFYEPRSFDHGYVFGGGTNDPQSGTLLHFAVRAAQKQTVEFLLRSGADKTVWDDKGRTPYQLAMEMNQTNLAPLLR